MNERKFVILLALLLIVFSMNIIFSNGISGIERIEVKKYDELSEEYEDLKVIKDKTSLKEFMRILNRAKHETNTRYEMAYPCYA